MSESRFEHIERSIEQQGAKIDRLDRFETRIIKAEQFQAQQIARRELWSFVATRALPVSLTVMGTLVAYITIRIKGGM